MRKQLMDGDKTPLYGATDEEYTIFSRESLADTEMVHIPSVVQDGRDQLEMKEPEKKLKYPKSVFFIISNEFCERFSYYGMRSVLSIYLTSALNYEENSATIIYHVFVMLCYFTPLFGGIMADAWLGKFKTILYVSLVYATGNIILAFGSVEAIAIPHRTLSLIGLLLIAVGTGGIKPCVSSFGGDQFVLPQQERQLEKFFSVFYFSINAGSVLSSFLTPIFRTIHCLDSDDCYPLAFGLPAVLMIVAIVFFVCGSPMYKRTKASGNIAVDIGGCVSHAIARKVSLKEKKDHWLDYADDKYKLKLIADIKVLMKIIVLFSPTIVFWALFEQQGSKWTFQAKRLNGDLGGYVIEPDQMQTLNAVLVLIFIPLFQSVVYPILAKLRLVRTPLQKLCVGGFLAAIAFVISGFLEIKIEANAPSLPGSGQSQLILYNSFNCKATFKDGVQAEVPQYGFISLPDIDAKNIEAIITGPCFKDLKTPIILNDEQVSSYLLRGSDTSAELFPLNLKGRDETERLPDVYPKLKVIYSGSDSIEVIVKKDDNVNTFSIKQDKHQDDAQKMTAIGTFSVEANKHSLPSITVAQGGVYTLMVTQENGELSSHFFEIAQPNSVNILWQIPQYIVITSAEIMFSITGLEFSYSQSPKSLKSIISSLWLLTDALGNVIILLIESIAISNKILEFFIYAAVMGVAMLVFTVLAIRYKYETPDQDEDENETNIQPEEQTKI